MRFLLSLLLFAASLSAAGPLRFHIKLDSAAFSRPVSGRLFVLMSDSAKPKERLTTGFRPGSSWLAAMEVTSLAPGEVFAFDPDVEAYPKPFSQAKAGDYQ